MSNTNQPLEPLLRIDKEGDWYHEGVRVTHPKVIDSLFEGLRKVGNQYLLQSGPKRFPVAVDDVPYVVKRLIETKKGYRIVLNDQSEEDLDLESLRIGADNVLYCSVKKGTDKARFNRPTYYQLAQWIAHDPHDKRFYLNSGGKRFEIQS